MKENEIIQEPKKRSLLKKVILFLLVLILLFFLYTRFIEPNNIVIHEYAIIDNDLPESFNGIKIVHFSDILYGSTINDNNLNKVIEKINALKPDIVIFTGDLLNKSIKLDTESINKIQEELTKIQATFKKYAVIGDSDYNDLETYKEIMRNSDFLVLENAYDFLYYGGNEPLLFIGTPSLLEQECNILLALKSEENIDAYFKIWLNHEPAILDELLNKGIKPNILFSGHTLGGLINLPFNYSLLNQDGVSQYTANYYKKEDIAMYISNGLGTYKYNVRFLNFPSINLYRLYKN